MSFCRLRVDLKRSQKIATNGNVSEDCGWGAETEKIEFDLQNSITNYSCTPEVAKCSKRGIRICPDVENCEIWICPDANSFSSMIECFQ